MMAGCGKHPIAPVTFTCLYYHTMNIDQIYSVSELTRGRWQSQTKARHSYVVVEDDPYVSPPITELLIRHDFGTNAALGRAASRGELRGKTYTLLVSKHQTTIKTCIAILFCIGLLAACVVISSLINFALDWFMMLGTALWAAKDSSKIEFNRYKSGISSGTVVLFFACALFWIVVFPWYLVMRCKIKAGTAVLKVKADECC
jgi:hypothetical protein